MKLLIRQRDMYTSPKMEERVYLVEGKAGFGRLQYILKTYIADEYMCYFVPVEGTKHISKPLDGLSLVSEVVQA